MVKTDRGTLEVGKLADIVLNGDPPANVSNLNVAMVIKDGEAVVDESRRASLSASIGNIALPTLNSTNSTNRRTRCRVRCTRDPQLCAPIQRSGDREYCRSLFASSSTVRISAGGKQVSAETWQSRCPSVPPRYNASEIRRRVAMRARCRARRGRPQTMLQPMGKS